MICPTYRHEKGLFAAGVTTVIGCDEVGRGCLAGPVVAAAVVMPKRLCRGWRLQVRDSKTLSALQRERAAAFIRDSALEWSIGEVDATTIDRVNIHRASLLAMDRATRPLVGKEGVVGLLVDGRFIIPEFPAAQKAIIDGDAKCLSIAAASIIAKVYRDALMLRLHEEYPAYGFDQHKGYGTPQHRAAIAHHGLTPLHRVTFCHV